MRHLTALAWWLQEPLAEALDAQGTTPQLVTLCLENREGMRGTLPTLSPLRQLRALRVTFCPPLEQLQQLTQLQCLDVEDKFCISPVLTRVIRYLSVQHCLTSVALEGDSHAGFAAAIENLTKGGDLLTDSDDEWWDGGYAAVVPLPSDAILPLPPAALEEFTLKYNALSPSELEAICAMPRLSRLQCRFDAKAFEIALETFNLEQLARLSQLDLGVFTDDKTNPRGGWVTTLARCTNLSELRLKIITREDPDFYDYDDPGFQYYKMDSPVLSESAPFSSRLGVDLTSFLPSMPLLEDLTIDTLMRVESWHALRQLQHLTRLVYTQKQTPDAVVLAPIVASLPKFCSLSLG